MPTPTPKPKPALKAVKTAPSAPLATVPIALIENGSFTDLTPTKWTTGAGSNYRRGVDGQFQYGYVQNTGENGWKAYVGDKIEVWAIGGNKFVNWTPPLVITASSRTCISALPGLIF